MKKIRFILTNIIIKIIIVIMTILGRKASHLPGVIALKLCPDFLGFMEIPENTIAITGTNGKTTVSNMLGDSFKELNIEYSNNKEGSNTITGIISTFIKNSSITGKHKYKYSILEIDERSSILIYKYIKPKYLIVTNLFRDSYERNAHVDYIFDILNSSIPDTTKLILNSDDLVSSRLKPNNDRVYFSIKLLEREEENRNSRVKDIYNCPKCDNVLIPEFIRYNHIGRYVCGNCDFKNATSDYTIEKFDAKNKELTITNNNKTNVVYSDSNNIVDFYNLLATYTLLADMEFESETIKNVFKNLKVVASRFNEQSVGDKKVIVMMSKAINPISSSRTFHFISKQEGNISIVFGNSKMKLGYKNSENTAWLYDNDFVCLNKNNIKQYITCGKRYKDFEYCLLLAGVPKEKIIAIDNFKDIHKYIEYSEVDKIFLLNDIDTINVINEVNTRVVKKLKEGDYIK